MKTTYDRLAKIDTKCSCHMAKMATTSIYGKNPLKDQTDNDLGTWYVALGI